MSGEERREQIIDILRESDDVISGEKLAGLLNVSRQVIVQDISILRAAKFEILSTNKGYYLKHFDNKPFSKIIKVKHPDSEEAMLKEMYLVVDLGGCLEDEFVYHKTYGVVKVKMNIKSRREADQYMNELRNGQSKPLSNLTSGYHYHTVTADSKEVLSLIMDELWNIGYLAPLRSYEPGELQKSIDEK